MIKTKVVELNLNSNLEAAREVAYATLFRANPHQSLLVERRLEEAGPSVKSDESDEESKVLYPYAITLENLIRYFNELTKAVAEFWNNCYDISFKLTMKPHELRGLYLPLIYSVVFASLGNLKRGNYEYRIKAKADEKPDREFLINFSAVLEENRDIVKGAIGQIGVRGAQPQEATMLCILSEIASDGRTAEYHVRDGVNVDPGLGGLASLVGLSLVEKAYSILYTGVEEVNFRQLTDTLVDKNLMAIKNSNPD